jgi:hypothetical protein
MSDRFPDATANRRTEAPVGDSYALAVNPRLVYCICALIPSRWLVGCESEGRPTVREFESQCVDVMAVTEEDVLDFVIGTASHG